GAGLLSFASPCVVPLVPGYLGYLSGASVGADGQLVGERRKVVAHALMFVLGFTLVFTAVGASVGLIGFALLRNMSLVQKGGGIILVVLGLHTLRLLNIPFLNRTFRADMSTVGRQRGYFGSLLIGAIFAAGWTPCVGIVLSGILTLAATSATVGQGALLLIAYSFGLGLPFVLSAFALEQARGWLRKLNAKARLIENVSGVMLVVMGLLVFSNFMSIMSAYWYRFFGFFL
ncbi:MAG: cytochrome c biogenesis protein CcdA, partial [Chloroflexota bacterium]